jgi:hypothetical protein
LEGINSESNHDFITSFPKRPNGFRNSLLLKTSIDQLTERTEKKVMLVSDTAKGNAPIITSCIKLPPLRDSGRRG